MIEIIVSLTLLLSGTGYTNNEIQCTMSLVKQESNFHLHSRNSKTGAYGLFQIMNIKTNMSMKSQVARFNKYIKARYSGSVCKALAHQQLKNWY